MILLCLFGGVISICVISPQVIVTIVLWKFHIQYFFLVDGNKQKKFVPEVYFKMLNFKHTRLFRNVMECSRTV